MAICAKPGWTCCFLIVWIAIAPGTLLTHLSVKSFLPHLKDLPDNVVQGFDETFKFAYLERDSQTVVNAAAAALQTCGVDANISCPSKDYPTFDPQQDSNTTAEQAVITASFKSSLDIVNKIANDDYFGVDDLNSTAESLNKIVEETEQLNDTMPCTVSTPLYCSIHTAAGSVIESMGSVTRALDSFKNSDVVDRWDYYHNYFLYLYVLPYIMVAALLFFTYFWIKGGVCCCCKGGTYATWALIPFAILWTISFGVYAAICAVGVVVKYRADSINVPVLKGSPSLETAINHIKANYPEFWNLVFAGIEDGLDLLLKASFLFVIACLIAGLYSLCECCCCPYRKPSEEELKAEA